MFLPFGSFSEHCPCSEFDVATNSRETKNDLRVCHLLSSKVSHMCHGSKTKDLINHSGCS